jgi:ribbon-helix-helix protein
MSKIKNIDIELAHFVKRGRPYKGYRKVTFKIPPHLVAKLAEASTRMQVNKSECVTEALRLWLGA